MSLKKESTSSINGSFNFFQPCGQNLVKFKTAFYNLCIPVITRNKEVTTSNSIILRSCCSKIADKLNESLELVKK